MQNCKSTCISSTKTKLEPLISHSYDVHQTNENKVTCKGVYNFPFSSSLLMLCNNSCPNTEILTKQIKISTVPDSLSFQSPECTSASKVAPSSLHFPFPQLFEHLPQTSQAPDLHQGRQESFPTAP